MLLRWFLPFFKPIHILKQHRKNLLMKQRTFVVHSSLPEAVGVERLHAPQNLAVVIHIAQQPGHSYLTQSLFQLKIVKAIHRSHYGINVPGARVRW
jgi:hypothetical protein